MKHELKPTPDSIILCQSIIKNLLHISYPGIQTTAQLIGIPVRTLQRQLHNSGITYRQLVQLTRLKMACHLIRDSDKNVTEIATALGYKDASSFSRAFKKWTNLSPRDYRQAL